MSKEEKFTENLSKLRRYCTFRERCTNEVKTKMYSLHIPENEMDEYLEILREDSYLNEERYARIFVRSKFNQNHWGKTKIGAALFAKRVPNEIVEIAFGEIEEKQYLKTLDKVLRNKISQLKDEDEWKKREKLIRYAIGRGFEQFLVIEKVNQQF